MGANPVEFSSQVVAARALAEAGGRHDFNELTRLFNREINHRTRDGGAPECLFLDVEESGHGIWATRTLGRKTESISRYGCRCFDAATCSLPPAAASCSATPLASHTLLTLLTPCQSFSHSAGQYDLVISCHSLSFLPQPRAVCFLKGLRTSVRSGGMLFISALGRYSALADAYPSGDLPLASRFYPLAASRGLALPEGTQVCLYSERDLCNTLFDAGWSVIRSSTSTENNVLATAMRP